MVTLQQLVDRLTAADGNQLLLALVVAAVLLLVIGVAGLLAGRDPVEQRLAAGVSRPSRDAVLSIRRDAAESRFRRLAPYLT
ncbi:MAG: hypothetical protein ACREH6_03965, partial [Geminicoccaceae bacterium]